MRKPGEHTLGILLMLMDNPDWIDIRKKGKIILEYHAHIGASLGALGTLEDDVNDALALIKALDARYQRKQDVETGHV